MTRTMRRAPAVCATCKHHWSAHVFDPLDQGRGPPKKCSVPKCLCLCYRRRDEVKRTDLYVTTFCNQAHRLWDGKPIAHCCYVLRVDALIAERDGRFDAIVAAGGMIKKPKTEMKHGVRHA